MSERSAVCELCSEGGLGATGLGALLMGLELPDLVWFQPLSSEGASCSSFRAAVFSHPACDVGLQCILVAKLGPGYARGLTEAPCLP